MQNKGLKPLVLHLWRAKINEGGASRRLHLFFLFYVLSKTFIAIVQKHCHYAKVVCQS